MPIMLEDENQSEEEYGDFGYERQRSQRKSSTLRSQHEREAAVVGLRKRGQRDMWNERR